jgi:hypothetical protein
MTPPSWLMVTLLTRDIFYLPYDLIQGQGICSGVHINEEPAKLNRVVALRALCPNSLFSKVVFSYFLSQNNPLVLVGFYQILYHHASKAKFSICHRIFL